MNGLLQLDLSPPQIDTQTQGMNRTSNEIGQSLFRDLLKRSRNGAADGSQQLSLYRDRGLEKGEGLSKKWDDDIQNIRPLYQHLLIPGSALPRLISFLEGRGFGRDSIHKMILAASDKTTGLGDRKNEIINSPKTFGRAPPYASPMVWF